MTRFFWVRTRLAPLGLLLAIALAIWIPLNRTRQTWPKPAKATVSLSTETPWLEIAALGHRPLLADFLLARALTHYGAHYHDPGGPRAQHLYPWIAAAARLDPGNLDALMLGSNLLAEREVDRSIDLLRIGNAAAPDEWRFPELIGFRYYFHRRNPRMAARYYEIASRLPGRPPYVPSLAGKFYSEAGRRMDAIRVLAACRDQTADARLAASFQQMIDRLEKGGKD